MKKSPFAYIILILSLFTLSAYGQIPENPVTTTASGGLRTSQINHLVICDNSYTTIQACLTAAGTNRSVLIPYGQHVGQTFTNPNGIVLLDLRTIPTFPTTGATSSVLGGVTLSNGQTSTLLSKVATTGTYADLLGLPTLGSIQINTVSGPLSFSGGTLSCPSCGSGGGGSGTVTTVNAGTTPSWLTFSIDNPTSTPTLNLTSSAIPNTALQSASININGQAMSLGGTYTVTGASAAISGTANQLGLLGPGGASITGSNVSVAPAATFTGTSNGGGTVTQVAFLTGTPMVGQQVTGTGIANPSFIYTLTNTVTAVPGSTSSGNTLINVSSSSLLYNGEQISGVGIPNQATVVCVSATVNPPTCDAGTTINLSSPATSTASATYSALNYRMVLTTTPTLGTSSAPVTLNLTAVATTTFPMSTQVQSLNNIFMASQYSSYPGANNGLASVFASPNCSSSCTVMIDPGDQEGSVQTNWPVFSHLIDIRNGQVYNYYHNQTLANQEVFSTSINQSGGQSYQARNFFPGAPGYDYGENGLGTSRGEYINNFQSDYFNSHTAGIMNVYGVSGTISQPGDINFRNVNLYLNPNAYSDSSEGVTLDRLYVFSAPPFFGKVTSGGTGATTLQFNCWSGRGCGDMAIYSPLIDLTTDVLSGSAVYTSTTNVGGGQVGNITTNFTVPVSITALLPYQASIQGVLFVPTSSTNAVSIQFVSGAATADASAICGGSACSNAVTVQLVNSSGAVRQLNDIVNLFANYPPTTPSGGRIVAFLTPSTVGTTPAVASSATAMGVIQIPRGSQGTVTTFAISGPTLNDATQCSGVATPCPFAPVSGAIMDLAGPYFNEVVSPTTVGTPINNIYPVTATLYFTHYPVTVYANTSASPSSGMVGRALESVNGTNYNGEDRVVNVVLGSTGPNTLVVGTTKTSSFTVFGLGNPGSGASYPINIYHASMIKSLINPTQTGNINGLYGNGSEGAFAIVEPNDTFQVGDMVENTSAASQNWTYHKEWVDIEDPYATWNHHTYYLNGPGLNGNIFNIINQNAPGSKYGQTALTSMNIVSSQVSGGVGTFYDTFAYPYLNQVTVGQTGTLNGFPTGSNSAYLNGQAITVLSTGVTNQTVTGSTVANNQTVTVATTAGMYNGSPFSGTGISAGEVISCSSTIAPPYCDPGTYIQISPLPAATTGSYTFTFGRPYFTANVTGATSTSTFTDVGSLYTANGGGIPSFMNWQGDMNNFVYMTTIPNSLFTIGNGNSAAIWPTSQSTLNLFSIAPKNIPGGSFSLYNLYAPTTGYSLSTVNSVTTLVVNGSFTVGGGGAQYVIYHPVTVSFSASSFLNSANWITASASPTSITLTQPASSFGYTTSTSYSIASNVITINGSGFPYAAGGVIQLGNYPTSTFLNGMKLTLTSANSTTLVATLTTSHADVATTTETGQVYRATLATVTETGSTNTRSFQFSTDLWVEGNFNATNGYFNTSLTSPNLVMTLATPSSSSATCTAGTVSVDATYVYVCTAANVRKRVALSSF